MDEFNYFFRETAHGIICAHTYQYEPDRSTWIFEMDEACFQGHGFDGLSEEESREILAQLYAAELAGHPLLLNRSSGAASRASPAGNWSHGGSCCWRRQGVGPLFGRLGHQARDGVRHRAVEAVVAHAETSVERAFADYEAARRTICEVIQHNADVSLAWFEHMGRSWDMEPLQFAMVVMCRAKSITYDN